MAGQTLFRKGAAKCMKSSITSPKQAKRLAKAILELQNCSLNELQRKGKVRKLNVANSDIYVFRVGLSERIVFSQLEDKNIVHDIVDVKKGHSIKSLLVNAKNG